MDLSAEEKQRIYQEEKARQEAQARLKREAQAKRTKVAGVVCLTILAFFYVIGAIVNSSAPNSGLASTAQAASPGGAAAQGPATDQSTSTPANSVSVPPAPKPKLVLKPNWTVSGSRDGYVKIKGQVVNKTGRDLHYAQISFNLYDKDGAQVGTAMSNTTNLEAGGTWKFKTMDFESAGKVDGAKLAELEGY